MVIIIQLSMSLISRDHLIPVGGVLKTRRDSGIGENPTAGAGEGSAQRRSVSVLDGVMSSAKIGAYHQNADVEPFYNPLHRG